MQLSSSSGSDLLHLFPKSLSDAEMTWKSPQPRIQQPHASSGNTCYEGLMSTDVDRNASLAFSPISPELVHEATSARPSGLPFCILKMIQDQALVSGPTIATSRAHKGFWIQMYAPNNSSPLFLLLTQEHSWTTPPRGITLSFLFINKVTPTLSTQQTNQNTRMITLICAMIGKTWRCYLMYCSRKWVIPTNSNPKPKPISRDCPEALW